MEEERQLDMLTQRRRLEGIQPDPEAPVKPYRGPALSHTPSDLKRLSAMSHDLDTKRYSDIEVSVDWTEFCRDTLPCVSRTTTG